LVSIRKAGRGLYGLEPGRFSLKPERAWRAGKKIFLSAVLAPVGLMIIVVQACMGQTFPV
ncbi:MAG: hypothetical protein M1398_08035, partial [Deltaproteobacteria bacterium]|nr:hypothetical protein [Deltaproteobacteria bacterium]